MPLSWPILQVKTFSAKLKFQDWPSVAITCLRSSDQNIDPQKPYSQFLRSLKKFNLKTKFDLPYKTYNCLNFIRVWVKISTTISSTML